MRIAWLLVAFAGCSSKPIYGFYCEGGVVQGRPSGGECIDISPDRPDNDPRTVGKAALVSRYAQPYTLRRTSAGKYSLLLDGAVAGTLEHDGKWVTVRLPPAVVHRMRSDAPGVFE